MTLPKLEHPRCDAKFLEQYLTSDLWVAERKVDGTRVYIYFEGGKTRTVTRQGTDRTASFKVPYVEELEGSILDGELYDPRGFNETLSGVLGGESDSLMLAAFDVPFASGEDQRRKPLEERRFVLSSIVQVLYARGFTKIHMLEWILHNKEAFYKAEIAEGREGIILKKINCGYGIQWVKCKGFKDTSVIVLGPAHGHGAQAYRIGVTDSANVQVTPLGTLKLVGEALKAAQKEDVFKKLVVDIKALSFDPTTKKFRQPSLVKVRPDLGPLDCTLSKVKTDFGVEG